jgi:ADP-heptose:LPS heptosyltransferase
VLSNAGYQVHFATKAAFAPLLEFNPHVHKLHLLQPGAENQLIESLRRQDFVWVLDLHKNLRTLRIKLALANVPSSSFPKLNAQKWILARFKINTMPAVHIVQRYAEALHPLGLTLDGKGLEFYAGIRATEAMQLLMGELAFECQPIAAVLGAHHATKQYPPEQMAKLLNELGKPAILLGGKAEVEQSQLISSQLEVPHYNAAGKLGLQESAALLGLSQCVVTGDTGLMHIAAALGVPIFSIWGNTVPEFGMYPYRAQHETYQVEGLGCRPCSKLGYPRCPKGHFACMRLQDPVGLAKRIQQSPTWQS